MRKQHIGKIVLVDDDFEDRIILEELLAVLNWPTTIEPFANAIDALAYLKKTDDKIFVIISDMNMQEMSGLEFKKIIDQDPSLVKKAIPFIFASTSASRSQVNDAYDYRIQGYFKKPTTIHEMTEMMNAIIQYWVISRHPNKD